jgi:hypothetical protein
MIPPIAKNGMYDQCDRQKHRAKKLGLSLSEAKLIRRINGEHRFFRK